MVRLSIIVPTPDGGNLDRLEESLRRQLRDGDEVIVALDTHTDKLYPLRTWIDQTPHWRFIALDAGRHAWGHPQINHGITQAKGDYLVFQDDDDVFAADALVNIRRAAKHLDPPRPLIFKFKAARAGGRAFPIDRSLAIGTIGGHCLVVPNVPEKIGKWTDEYTGDNDFIVETLRLWEPLEPVWRPEVITYAR